MQQNGRFLHAFEINGMRKWQENKKVIPLAERWRSPSFPAEIDIPANPAPLSISATRRPLRNSSMKFATNTEATSCSCSNMPIPCAFASPAPCSTSFATIPSIRKDLGRWDDRVFHPDKTGEGFLPISAFWKSPPPFVDRIFSVFRLAENATVQWAAKRVYADEVDLQALSDGPSEAIS